MPDHSYCANLIWQIADLLRGPYRPPQYEWVVLPMTVLRRFDCVLAPTKAKVLAGRRSAGGRLHGDALDSVLNRVAGQRFHNQSPLDFERLRGGPDHIDKHLVSYIEGFSRNVRDIDTFNSLELDAVSGWAELTGDVDAHSGGTMLRVPEGAVAASSLKWELSDAGGLETTTAERVEAGSAADL